VHFFYRSRDSWLSRRFSNVGIIRAYSRHKPRDRLTVDEHRPSNGSSISPAEPSPISARAGGNALRRQTRNANGAIRIVVKPTNNRKIKRCFFQRRLALLKEPGLHRFDFQAIVIPMGATCFQHNFWTRIAEH